MFSKRRYPVPKNSSRNSRSYFLFVQTLAIIATFVILLSPPVFGQEEDTPTVNPKQFDFGNQPFFLSNAIEAFSEKFPFDMLGSTSDGAGGGGCPQYEFFGENVTLCILSDIIMAVKIPAQIAIALMFYQRI